MAKKLKMKDGKAPPAQPPKNSDLRNKRLEDALRRTYQLDRQIKALTDQHTGSLKDEKSKIKKGLREDLNITAKVFNARYFAYRLEADARAADDNPTLENLRELFTIAPVGTTANMFDAIDEDDADEGDGDNEPEGNGAEGDDEPAAVRGYGDDELRDLEQNGYMSAKQGRGEDKNPHPDEPVLSARWLKGHRRATEEMETGGTA